MVKQAADAIAHSVIMAALTRIAILLGTPLLVTAITWGAGNLIALREMVAVQVATQARLVGEVADLQGYRRDAFARGVARDQEDKALRSSIEDMKKALERINDRALRGSL